MSTMSDKLDDRLKRWIESIVDGVAVSLSAPEAQTSGQGIGLYLLDLMQSSPISTMKPPPLQLTFRYLVTTWSERPEDAHEILSRLFFAAMENKDFEVERNPPSIEIWRAFGVNPRPAFLLRAPLLQERPRTPAKLVREPVRVDVMISRVAFHGKIVGPEDIPISHCLVEVPALGLSTSSDREGRFNFPGLPSLGKTHFLIKARGQQLSVDSEQSFPDRATPMVIRLSSLED
jgi:hypothetical protein